MVGECSRKEPVGEVDKWRNKVKVWEILEKGGIANYIAKLHGFDLEVTNSMVHFWKDGKVKVNDFTFLVNEEVVSTISKILAKGLKIFRDKKISTNVVKDFVKSSEEMNDLVKYETFYEIDSIKKL